MLFSIFFCSFRTVYIFFNSQFSLRSLLRFRRLHVTSQRLGAGGGYDTVHAEHKRSYSHCTFRGATPPLAPNRQLSAADFGVAVRVSFSRLIFISNDCLFHRIFGLYNFVEYVDLLTTFSGCTFLSGYSFKG